MNLTKHAWEPPRREMPELAELVALRSLSLLYHHLPLSRCRSLTQISMAVITLCPSFVFRIPYFFFPVDLYGTEDLSLDPTTENAHVEPQKNSFSPEHDSPNPAAEPAAKGVTVAPTRTPAAASPTPIASWTEPPSSAAERPAPPPVINAPQQIPTYQESNTDDRGPGRSSYHGVAVEERSVRPSEMKDEG
ncbi:hypothetical protein F5148DRAFT_733023 [Russula earlei]|uniref:Uncharacterized protein n=1 Tax=Russula earlei TaxID=71964 RepID=A0ACC0UMM0_9AGAM|nr:hypothetical protein F5148DRAFT_733023 [Russula earlei]